MLFFGLRWQSKHPDTVAVDLWNQLPALEQAPVEPQPEVKPEPKPEPKIEPKPEPKRDLKMETKLAPVPKVESAPKKPDIAVEREKKAQKKKIETKSEPPLKFNENQRIREQLEQEERDLSQTTRSREAAKVSRPSPSAAPVIDAAYADRIRGKIKGNIVLPPDISGNPEAVFDVKMLPTGEISAVQLRKSSGHRLYDEAVERAIRKSSPLPLPERRDQFRRELELRFRPKE